MTESIPNFRRLSNKLLTSGQPAREQFSLVRDEGCCLVVNLAMPNSDGFLPDEGEIVEGLGMRYVAIAIAWDAPQLDDARQLFEVLQTHRDHRVLVHCAMNMRVSALMFIYRTQCEGVDEAVALRDLHAIWTPNETWQKFMDDVKNDMHDVRTSMDVVRERDCSAKESRQSGA